MNETTKKKRLSATLAPYSQWVSLLLLSSLAHADPLPPRFVDIAADLGLRKTHTGGDPQKQYIVEAKGGGATVLDFDGDGDFDIYWVNGAALDTPRQGGGNALYRNDGSGFTDVAAPTGAEGRGWGMGAVSADYDNDGDADLYITSLQENILYRNDTGANPRFLDVAAQAGVAIPNWSTGAALADCDLDGDLDLYVANYLDFDREEHPPLGAHWQGVEVFVGPRSLTAAQDVFYRNEGDGTFSNATFDARLSHPSPGYGLGVLFADYDLDGYPDLFVANDSSPNFLYRNRGDGRFTDLSIPANIAYSAAGKIQAGMGVAWGDYDSDGDPDILVSHFEGEYNTLYRNDGNGRFADITASANLVEPSLPYVGFGANFFDYDNDADLDLFVANGHVYPQIDQAGSGSSYAQVDHLFANDNDGTFHLRPNTDLADTARVSRGSCTIDYDNDGDIDLFVAHLNRRPSLLRNDGGNRKNWLGIALVGKTSNKDGIGARVRLVAGERAQFRDAIRGSSFLSSEAPRLHFGLGSNQHIDTLEIRWPTGSMQRLINLPANQYLLIEEE
ncbi:MAG TPA: CRTAC1 family protein [Candidatus Latescibacteria bacterium]|nr:CRTAC1 family protein [Candidatus Latescibacterota bacterium]